MIPREEWASYDQKHGGTSIFRSLSGLVERIETETWLFRADLTYLAEAP